MLDFPALLRSVVCFLLCTMFVWIQIRMFMRPDFNASESDADAVVPFFIIVGVFVTISCSVAVCQHMMLIV